MDIDHITPSVLHVTAKENLNIEQDLLAVQNKSISQLVEEQANEEKEESQSQEG
jgi:hypothetical protein